jgi:ParB family chromosome partitioning protein
MKLNDRLSGTVETAITVKLKPHPLNEKLYGRRELNFELRDSIKEKGILVPLIVTPDDVIVSGHSRWEVAKILRIDDLPVQVLDTKDEAVIEECLIHCNKQRDKTEEQKAREFKRIKAIEREKAKKRQGKRTDLQKEEEDIPQNSAESDEGDARTIAAEAVGLSHTTAEHAEVVVDEIDELEEKGEQEQADDLRQTLNNESVNAAFKKTKKGAKPAPESKAKQSGELSDFETQCLSRLNKEWMDASDEVKQRFAIRVMRWVKEERAA